MVGERTAEEVKIAIGSAMPMEDELMMDVRGRDSGRRPAAHHPVRSSEITEAITEPLEQIIGAVRAVLEETPPELSSDIIDKGMILTGGGAMLRHLDDLLTEVTGVPCNVAENPLSCVAIGTGLALEHFDFFRKSLVQRVYSDGPSAGEGVRRPALPQLGLLRQPEPARRPGAGGHDTRPDAPGHHRP